ncbi:MAG: restriction endonuclease subunit S [Spirochaetota bacterium]
MSVPRIKLSEAAFIRQGYQFRSKIESSPEGEISVVQMADIKSGKTINWDSVQYVSDKQIKPDHYLNPGDIIFCARGLNNYSLVLKEDLRERTVAVSQFLVIDTDKTKLLPSYLAWYLSQNEAIEYLRSNTLMSTVPLINRRTLDEMPIPLPPLEKQNTIANIYELSLREENLIERISSLKAQLLNAIMYTSIIGRA